MTDAAYNAQDNIELTSDPQNCLTIVRETIDALKWTAEARDALKLLARRKGECGEAFRAQVAASAALNKQFPDIGDHAAQELDELAFALSNLMGEAAAPVNPLSMQRLQALGFIKITVSR